MPLFEYQAMDAEGKQRSGTTLGKSLDEALKKLQNQGLIVTGLSQATGGLDPTPPPGARARVEQPRGAAIPGAIPTGPQPGDMPPPPPLDARNPVRSYVIGGMFEHVGLRDLMFFFRQYGTMLGAGVNPVQALQTLSNQTTSRKLKSVLQEGSAHVREGRPFSACMQRYPEVFSPLAVSMIRAGELGGTLEHQCFHLADYYEHEHSIVTLIKKETFYPKMLVVVAIIIIVGANFIIRSVVGQPTFAIKSPFESIGFYLFVAALILGLLFYNRVFSKIPAFRETIDQIALRIPYIGKTAHGFAMARFGRAFGALYRSGMSMPESTRLAADACGNLAVRRQIYPASEWLKEGIGITEAWGRTGAFNQIVLDMTGTGEQTGNLDQMLLKVSEYYEDEGRVRAKQAAQVLTVVVMLAVFIFIGMIVINFWTGYFTRIFEFAEP